MIEKDYTAMVIIRNLTLNEKAIVMNRNKFVQMESRSNDRTKWLIELIDRSL